MPTVETSANSPQATTDSALDALEAMLAPFSPVVLVERPGSKHERRCEVVTGPDGQLSDMDADHLAPLLEEALTWDGFLLAVVRSSEGVAAPCVWHVLNGDFFALAPEHASSLLDYLDGLRPEHWPPTQSVGMIQAPMLADLDQVEK